MEQAVLKDKAILVTGGSRGIGKAIAEQLSKQNVKIILTSKDQDRLQSSVDELKDNGSDLHTISCDLANPDDVKRMTIEACTHFGGLDILINNAGMGIMKPFEESTIEDWYSLMNINALAPFIICQECVPALKKSNYAMIVNIGSVMGINGYVNQSVYAASKHALMGFTKVMSQELQKYDIRVHAVNPGGVATDLAKTMRPDLDTSGMMKPGEIANIVMFLLQNRNNAVIDDLHIRRATGTAWY